MTKYFDLFSSEPMDIMMTIGMVAKRCVGEEVDPETNKDYSEFENVTISIIRSDKRMPQKQ